MADWLNILMGQAKPYANEFRSTVQDPFQQRIASIVDPLGAKRKAGTLTYDEVLQAQERLEQEISAFEGTADMYKGLGSSQSLVVSQARNTLKPIIASWRDTFTRDLQGLPKPPGIKRPDAPPEEAPSLDPALARKQAMLAADQLRKRTASGGRRSTLLGGAMNMMRGRKTVLGGY